MVNDIMIKALNDQVAMEAFSSNAYLAMASWCEVKGLRGATAFFYDQSDEERMHMLKLVRYINDSGRVADIPALNKPQLVFQSLKDVFFTSLQQEQTVTESINNLVELAFSQKDHATYQFLQWYVAEQHEEETLFRSILDTIELGGEDHNLLIIDQEITKIRAEIAKNEAA